MNRLIDLLPIPPDTKDQIHEIEKRITASDTKEKAALILKQRKIIKGVK
jgi:hypothetical protein